jgi:hypothetical protein
MGGAMYYFVFPDDGCENTDAHCSLDLPPRELALREAFRVLTDVARDATGPQPVAFAVDILGDDRTPLMRATLKLDVEELHPVVAPVKTGDC